MDEEKEVNLDDVLHEYMASCESPSSVSVDEWVRRYPQYAKEITDFAVTWSLSRYLPEPEIQPEELERRTRRGIELMHKVLRSQAKEIPQKDASLSEAGGDGHSLDSIFEAGKRMGLSLHDIARLTDLSARIVALLDRRQIHYSTIPNKAVEKIASAIRQPLGVVSEYLQGELRLTAAHYRAEAPPEIAPKQDFFDLIKSDMSLGEGNRKAWLSLRPAQSEETEEG